MYHRRVARLCMLHMALVLALALAGGCRKREASALVVHGAASLTESLTAVSEAYAAQGGAEVTLVFGPTSQLARQIQSGAPADVFVSADEAWMDTLDDAGLLQAGTRRELLRNRLVLIVPREAEFVPRSLAELASPQLRTLAVAGENVPAGRYADTVLSEAGLATALAPKLTRGDSVRTVLHWVAEGEADAGFVYATDALADDRVEVALELPRELQPSIVYPIAIVAHTQHADEAARFVEFCFSEGGRALFEQAGFVVVEP